MLMLESAMPSLRGQDRYGLEMEVSYCNLVGAEEGRLESLFREETIS